MKSEIKNFTKSISKSTTIFQSNFFNMQVDNNIQNKNSPIDSEHSPVKEEAGDGQNKEVQAQNRIARYEQKPERKASKMLVRLLQWADKLVIKFFTKKLLPIELQIFFNREARANKVQLKKAQIDYSVEDFAVRLYVFWVCQNYFQKAIYEEYLRKLLFELRDELSRKKKNLAESLQLCEEQTQKRQKQQELKWMGAIINGLNVFISRYLQLNNQDEVMDFLLDVTSNIMIDCLRKPGNKLVKKKEKLKTKVKYFQEKITEILGNPDFKDLQSQKQKKSAQKIIQKNTIIISPGQFIIDGLTRTSSNTSAFQKYKAEEQTKIIRGPSKKQDFQVRLQYPKKIEPQRSQQIMSQIQNSQKTNQYQKVLCQSSPTSQVKMDQEMSQSANLSHHSSQSLSVQSQKSP